MEIFNKTIGVLEEALNIRSEKNRVIASNIANQDTPGYRAKELNFRDSLKSAADPDSPTLSMTQTNASHLGLRPAGQEPLQPVEIPGTSKRLDGNSVDPEMEMAKLAENQILYNASIQFISDRFKQLQTAITEGR